MPENIDRTQERYRCTQNRELSWLQFNQRVLEEALDPSNPPMEQLKFISIFTSNLDEFFMVRVGSLFDLAMACPEEIDRRSGMTPGQQLERIYAAVPPLIQRKQQIYQDVMSALAGQGVAEVPFAELRQEEKQYVSQYFRANILPVLSPMIIGSHHPVPHLDNKGLYVVALLQGRRKTVIGLIPVPDVLPPYLILPGRDTLRFIRLETIILHWAYSLFGAYAMLECCVMSVTRNADINFDDEKFEDNSADFRTHVSALLKDREHLSVVRLELSRAVSESFTARLARLVHVEPRQIFIDAAPLNMKYVFRLADALPPRLKSILLYPPYTPRWAEDIDPNHGMIEQIQQHDKLLFFPFDSPEPFLRLLAEAAERPDVVSIKITIYRLASSSKIARLLCRAAENGKDVIVLMELRARFDEANNVAWSKVLENAGCQIIYGSETDKCHSKICLITLRNRGRLHYITQVGTGNYNEKTNTMYTDLSYMTSSPVIGEDATLFFQNLLINELHGQYEALLVSPCGIARSVAAMIDEQIRLGAQGYICIKINALTDREIIDKLIQASQAGVEVQLIVRGICCILPGIAHYTDHIHVTSIVGRFLEHARIYCFGRDPESKFYISSADFMGRNLHHRIEVACPIHDPKIQDQLKWILSAQLQDTKKASFVNFTGTYTRKSAGSADAQSIDYQQQFMDGTIHQLEPFVPPKARPFTRIIRRLRQMLDNYSDPL